MKPGHKLNYLCRTGARYNARLIAVRPDGSVDLAVDAGGGDWLELTRIPLVDPAELKRGTCADAS